MKLLFVDGCISNHSPSRTRILCDHYLTLCRQAGWTIQRVDLSALSLSPLTAEGLSKREQALTEQRFDDEALALAWQFQQADRIVIGAPYWDLSFPAAVKTYIEHIMVCGVTFRYGETGAVGLCQADKLVVLTTAGGPIQTENLGFSYLKAIAKMVGISDAVCFCADGLDIWGADVSAILSKTMETMEDSFHDTDGNI